MAKIEIFTGPGCRHCETAKHLLRRNGLDFTEHDISDAETLAAMHARLPRVRSIPQIFIDGRHLGNEEDLRLHLGC